MARAFLSLTVDGATKKFPLEAGALCRIGRNPDNTIVLDDKLVSRYHAVIIATPGGEFQLTNPGSRNGTTVNGVLVNASVSLRQGDLIRIGVHQLQFEQETETVETAPAVEFDATSVSVSYEVISVLVVDIRDYTGLSRRLGESRISEVVGAFLRESGGILADQGSWNTKYIGDAVMGVWRHESSNGRELFSIFTALTSVMKVAGGLQARFNLDQPIRTGAGINTGPAALGNMGSYSQSDFTALGDVVNKAFRLETATRTIGTDVALGDSTYRFLENLPGASSLLVSCSVPLKGYEGLQQAWGLSAANLPSFINIVRKAFA